MIVHGFTVQWFNVFSQMFTGTAFVRDQDVDYATFLFRMGVDGNDFRIPACYPEGRSELFNLFVLCCEFF